MEAAGYGQLCGHRRGQRGHCCSAGATAFITSCSAYKPPDKAKQLSHVCSSSTAQEETDLPAKRIWEAKVLAPTSTAGRRFVLWSRWKPTKAAFQWMAGKMGWWPVE